MCGISGFYNAKEDYSKDTVKWSYVLDSMRKCLSRRGNDEFGKYLTRHAGFSHARLCIRDLFHGSQPIVRSSFAGEYAIVYNGELYNTDELKTDLHSLGYTFSTTTDTEVILYAYMEYGAEFVQKLNGMSARVSCSAATVSGSNHCFIHIKTISLFLHQNRKPYLPIPDSHRK